MQYAWPLYNIIHMRFGKMMYALMLFIWPKWLDVSYSGKAYMYTMHGKPFQLVDRQIRQFYIKD